MSKYRNEKLREEDRDLYDTYMRARIRNTYSKNPLKTAPAPKTIKNWEKMQEEKAAKERERTLYSDEYYWVPGCNIYGVRMGRPPEGKQEMREGWSGVVRLMNYFQHDAGLAAATLGVTRATINNMINRGYVPVYIAVLAHHKCDTLEWEAWGLVPYLAYEDYDALWPEWLDQVDEIEETLYRMRDSQRQRHAKKKKAGR